MIRRQSFKRIAAGLATLPAAAMSTASRAMPSAQKAEDAIEKVKHLYLQPGEESSTFYLYRWVASLGQKGEYVPVKVGGQYWDEAVVLLKAQAPNIFNKTAVMLNDEWVWASTKFFGD